MRVSPRFWRLSFALWIPIAVAVTGLAALTYAAVQQDLRQGAEDPQISMAEDAARRLGAGLAPSAVLPSNHVDVATSLEPFLMVFDAGGKPLASSVVLDGQPPSFPGGVFASVRSNGEDRLTWQPRGGVRVAAVVTRYRDGFVVAGRNMRAVEDRVGRIGQLVALMWLITLAATAVASGAAAALLLERPL
jgi:hypothetical protein